MAKPLEVAVVGGGIGGMCVAIGLVKHKHINVQVYEAANEFAEIGAGVIFGLNAIKALAYIDPEAEKDFKRISTRNLSPDMKDVVVDYRIGMGPREGYSAGQVFCKDGATSVHRAKFLEVLVNRVPKEICHFGKRLSKIEDDANGPVVMHFSDGTTATADCVIGADGVHSTVRKHVVDVNDAESGLQFAGALAYRGLVPMKKASALLGERHAGNSTLLAGKDGFVMTYPIDYGETFNIAVVKHGIKSRENLTPQPADFKTIEAEFSGWGKAARDVVSLLDTPATLEWSFIHYPSTPTYVNNRVAIMGDAAHATAPFQAQGAGQAIEDASVLSAIFEHVRSPAEVHAALQAFDAIRRPFAQAIGKSSVESGQLHSMRMPGVMDDPDKMFEETIKRWVWVYHREPAPQIYQALATFEILAKRKILDPSSTSTVTATTSSTMMTTTPATTATVSSTDSASTNSASRRKLLSRMQFWKSTKGTLPTTATTTTTTTNGHV